MSDEKPLVLAIDDEQFYLDEIRYELSGKGVDLKLFRGPTDFGDNASKEDIEQAKLVIVDYDLGSDTCVEKRIAHYIRSSFKFSGKIILLSLLDDFGPKDNAIIKKDYDAVLNKETFSWSQIEKYFV